MASHTAEQSQADTAGYIACDRPQACRRSRGKKRPQHGSGSSYKNTYRYCRRVGGFRSERQRCGSIAPT